MNAADRLIVALDVPTSSDASALCARLDQQVRWYKIGLELFCSSGPDIVRDFTSAGRKIFVDLKLHDIPATVGRTVKQLSQLGAGLLTVHASGGRAMMEAASAAAGPGMKILAVTALTSLDQDDLDAVGVQMELSDLVIKRALLAAESGCGGVVASPHEAARLREVLPKGFLIVTPGIRPAGSALGDQKRVMSPAEALAAGADMIVVGRPIRDAANPVSAAQSILEELS
ncbi:MAG: orotidine-5'-phosphate decarboxylase [Kofleriaceae bacterium]|nr:orotidine-5'-phosphate decarboxylase [Kofleriaceae bacterium]